MGSQAGDVPVLQDTPQGGSSYGAGTLAGAKGERQPTENELAIAKHQARLYPSAAVLSAACGSQIDCDVVILHTSASMLCLQRRRTGMTLKLELPRFELWGSQGKWFAGITKKLAAK